MRSRATRRVRECPAAKYGYADDEEQSGHHGKPPGRRSRNGFRRGVIGPYDQDKPRRLAGLAGEVGAVSTWDKETKRDDCLRAA